jgi:cell shape-determining protein MreD
MRLFLIVMLTAGCLLVQPIADQVLGDFALRPNLCLAPVAIAISLCPGAAAVVWCGILGLILDCLAGPHLGARAVCFSLLAALGSVALAPRPASWLRRLAGWGAILFGAEFLSRIVQFSSVGDRLPLAATVSDAAIAATATTIFLGGIWLVARFLSRGPRTAHSIGRFAVAIGRTANGD